MIVRIDKSVHLAIEDFYDASMRLHPLLSKEIVIAKKLRLYAAIRSLSDYAHVHPMARYKRSWIDAGYREFIAEDFHFAYKIMRLKETNEEVAYVVDACHSLLYINPEDRH